MRTRRGGMSLVEVLVAVAILATSAWALIAMVSASYRQVTLELRREAARAAATNVLSHLSTVRFKTLEETFGPDAPYARDPLASPLLREIPVPAKVAAMDSRVKIARAPADPGSGYLEVRLVYQEDDDRPQAFVLGRTMTDPARAGRLGDAPRGLRVPENLVEVVSERFGRGGQEYRVPRAGAGAGAGAASGVAGVTPEQRAAIEQLLAAQPADAYAHVVMRIAKMDARDGKLDLDWPALVALGARSGWEAVLRAIARHPIPDGDYRVHWDAIPLVDEPGAKIHRTGAITLYLLTAMDGTTHFLVHEQPGPGQPEALNGEPARHFAFTALPAAATPGTTHRETQELTALVVEKRVLLVHEPVDGMGRAGRFEPRMLVRTLEVTASLLQPEAARKALEGTAAMVGLALKLREDEAW